MLCLLECQLQDQLGPGAGNALEFSSHSGMPLSLGPSPAG